jgi:5'/3'-nucleotidase
LAALKCVAAKLGDVFVLAPRDAHSYAGHRVTTDAPLDLVETGPQEYTLSGTPADCVRVALSALFPDVDCVLAGINRGGNLGADVFISGTVAAAREAALLGKPAIAISQYIRRNIPLDWNCSQMMALPLVERLMSESPAERGYWNVNLPHVETQPDVVHCDPDCEPLDVRFRRERDQFHYAGSYHSRPRTTGRDVDLCFGGAITVSRLRL